MPPQPPQPPEPPQPQPEPHLTEYVGLPQEMINVLKIEPALNPADPHWRVKKVEIQSGTNNFSAFAIADGGDGALFFWPSGSVIVPFKADPTAPEGAKEWAASMPMFNLWGSYGVMMRGPDSEILHGIGLYQQEGDVIVAKTGHHPVLVYFEWMEGSEPEPPQPVPPEPNDPDEEEPVSTELTVFEACQMVGLELIEDRLALEKYVGAVKTRESRAWNGIVVHYTASDLATQTCASIAKFHTDPKTKGGRAYPCIAYHILVDWEAKPHFVGPFRHISIHTHDDSVNADTIAICVMGLNKITDAQVRTVRKLIEALGYWLANNRKTPAHPYVLPHCYVSDTACPGKLKTLLVSGG